MIEPEGPLSLSRQSALLGVSRPALYDRPKRESAEKLALMRRIDELHMDVPFYGSRQNDATFWRLEAEGAVSRHETIGALIDAFLNSIPEGDPERKSAMNADHRNRIRRRRMCQRRRNLPIRRVAMLAGWVAAGLIPGASASGQGISPDARLTVTELWVAAGYTRLDALAGVTGVAENPLGKVWIASANPGTTLAVDPATDGENDVVIAREGDGPGELRGSTLLDVMPDGNMAIFDTSRGAVEIYGADGKPVRRVMLTAPGVSWVKGFVALASGGFVLSGGVQNGRPHLRTVVSRCRWRYSGHATRRPGCGQCCAAEACARGINIHQLTSRARIADTVRTGRRWERTRRRQYFKEQG